MAWLCLQWTLKCPGQRHGQWDAGTANQAEPYGYYFIVDLIFFS